MGFVYVLQRGCLVSQQSCSAETAGKCDCCLLVLHYLLLHNFPNFPCSFLWSFYMFSPSKHHFLHSLCNLYLLSDWKVFHYLYHSTGTCCLIFPGSLSSSQRAIHLVNATVPEDNLWNVKTCGPLIKSPLAGASRLIWSSVSTPASQERTWGYDDFLTAWQSLRLLLTPPVK